MGEFRRLHWIPASAGMTNGGIPAPALDSGLRRNDDASGHAGLDPVSRKKTGTGQKQSRVGSQEPVMSDA